MIIHTLSGVMDSNKQQSAKEAVGIHAARLVEDGMQVGLGTGSTTAFAIREIGRRIKEEGLRIVGTPTSFAAERLGREMGIPIVSLDVISELDIALDGADEVDPALNLIKGRGAAHTREKVVAALASRFVALVDSSKLVDQLGILKPVPVEVLPMAVTPIMHQLEDLGADPVIRMGVNKDGPVVTDQGFWIVDAQFGAIADPRALDVTLHAIPGVLDHGLFIDMAETVLVAEEDGSVRTLKKG
ncbi:MAG: ribose-5-phosphate isomerase RpiA [Rhodothermales bacterium]